MGGRAAISAACWWVGESLGTEMTQQSVAEGSRWLGDSFLLNVSLKWHIKWLWSVYCSGPPPPPWGHKWMRFPPFNDESYSVALVQDAFELGHAICARPLEGDLIWDADDLHGSRVAGDFAVGDRHHVIETKSLRWRKNKQTKKKGFSALTLMKCFP